MYRLLLCFSLLYASAPVFAQSNEGTDFWVGFMEHVNVNANEKILLITSKTATSGNVSFGTFSEDFTVPANGIVQITMPVSAEHVGSENIENKGIHVTAQNPISLYAHQYAVFRSEAALVLPVGSLGQRYYHLSYTGLYDDNRNDQYPSEFLIVAVSDDTEITITPRVETGAGRPAGVPFTIELDEGQSYQVQAWSGEGVDLSGSYIEGNQPFALFSGNKWTQVPTTCTLRDNLYEQMYPLESWGRKFVVAPFRDAIYDVVRVMAAQNNTQVFRDQSLDVVLQAGDFYEFRNNGEPVYLEGSAPILVAQYNIGGNCNSLAPNGTGDPSMVFLNAVEQTRDTVTVYSSSLQDIQFNYLNVIVRASDTSTLQLDGQLVLGQGTLFESLPGNDAYRYIRLQVSNGSHTLIAEGCGLNVTAYGYGPAESYAYSGGANFTAINTDPIPPGGCLSDTIQFGDGLIPGRMLAFWDFGDGTFSGELQPEHQYADLGLYDVQLLLTDLCLNAVDTFARQIEITLRQAVEASGDTSVCVGETVFLGATDVEEALYAWRGPGDFQSNEQFPVLESIPDSLSGQFQVRGIVSGCATFPQLVEVEVRPLPAPNLGNDTTICGDGPIELEAGDFFRYQWQNGSPEPNFLVTEPGQYWVEVSDELNCQGADSLIIEELCPPRLFVPSGFTPNGDGLNEEFRIVANFMVNFEFRIFNRWGNMIFQTDNPDVYWDGRLPSGRMAGEGVYIWVAHFDWPGRDGFIYPTVERGTLTVIR